MKKIAVLGTLLVDEILQSKLPFKQHGCNKMNLSTAYGGSMHNVAWNLSTLSLNCHFYTKLGNDQHAISSKNELEMLGCTVHNINVNLPTPRFYTFHMANESHIYATMTSDFLLHINDRIDYHSLCDTDYIITDNANSSLINEYIKYATNAKIILSRCVPDLSLLENIEGIVLNEWEISQYDQNHSIDEIANNLIKNGCTWIIVTKSDSGATLYSSTIKHDLLPNLIGDKTNSLGCGDALLSGLVYGLAHNLNTLSSLKLGMKSAEIVLSTPVALSSNITQIKELIDND